MYIFNAAITIIISHFLFPICIGYKYVMWHMATRIFYTVSAWVKIPHQFYTILSFTGKQHFLFTGKQHYCSLVNNLPDTLDMGNNSIGTWNTHWRFALSVFARVNEIINAKYAANMQPRWQFRHWLITKLKRQGHTFIYLFDIEQKKMFLKLIHVLFLKEKSIIW